MEVAPKSRLTPAEFAKEYGLHPKTVYRYCAQGKVKSFKIGGKRFVLPINEQEEISRRAL